MFILTAEPSVGIAAHIDSFTGDLTGFTARFELIVENIGNTPLTDLQVADNLAARFQGTDFPGCRSRCCFSLCHQSGF